MSAQGKQPFLFVQVQVPALASSVEGVLGFRYYNLRTYIEH